MFFTKPDWNEWGQLADHLRRPGPPLEENTSVADITVDEARRYHEATRAVGAGAGRHFARTTDLSGKDRHDGYRRRLRGVLHRSLPGEPGACGRRCSTFRRSARSRAAISTRPACRTGSRPCPATSTRTISRPVATWPVMASNLPMYGRWQIAWVVKKVHGALLPGGEFHLIGEALAPDRSGPGGCRALGPRANASRLHRACPFERRGRRLFRAAGFRDIAVEDFLPGHPGPHLWPQGLRLSAARIAPPRGRRFRARSPSWRSAPCRRRSRGP